MQARADSSEAASGAGEWALHVFCSSRASRTIAGIADSWKPTRREIGSVPAGTMVEVLEDVIVVDAPDIVWVTEPIAELKR